MKNVTTTFAGLRLKNPVIISSSDLTNSSEKNKKLEEAGAAAVILKSLFEEQIMMQISAESQHASDYFMTGQDDYMAQYIRANQLSEYLSLIRESKKVCTIPVIASLNCFSADEWENFSREIEKAGADAIELNIMFIPTDKDLANGVTEQRYVEILRRIKTSIRIPVIVKLTQYVTNLLWLINQLHANGADGIVLFNRMYRPDIDIKNLEYVQGDKFGHEADLYERLRWTGIASSYVKTDYAVSGGLFSGEDLIKSILAGASAVEVCSSIYKNGAEVIKQMLGTLDSWMDEKGFEEIRDFKGIMNVDKQGDVNHFERTQFLKYYHMNN